MVMCKGVKKAVMLILFFCFIFGFGSAGVDFFVF